MEAMEAILARKSTRDFKSRKIPADVMDEILRAASAAPVAMGDYGSLHLIVVQDADLLERISMGATRVATRQFGYEKKMVFGAPTMVIVSSKPNVVAGRECLNVGCVAENISLAATSFGVDSLIWSAAATAIVEDAQLLEDVSVPAGFAPVLAVSLGYATKDVAPKTHEVEVTWI